jgi:hypothetical protein
MTMRNLLGHWEIQVIIFRAMADPGLAGADANTWWWSMASGSREQKVLQ